VTPFAGDLVALDVELSVYDNASAYTCSENHAKDDAGFRSRTIDGLRKGEAIRVVLHAYWPSQSDLKVAVERLAV
jgi:hypothetical protein